MIVKHIKYIVVITLLFNSFTFFAADASEIICVAGGGCGSHLCLSEEEMQNSFSTCEWRDSYACYPKLGKCEVQPNGKCGWSQTPELLKCLEETSRSPML